MMEAALKNPEISVQRTLIGSKLGRYEILAKIASGGMASVYVARTQGIAGFERLTAIKVLHANLAHEEEFVKMFLDEARLAARIRHTNVVATLEISDTLDTGYYLVMEYIEGDHLGKLLSGSTKAGVQIDLPVVLRIITDILYGLSAAHNLVDDTGKKLNLVHRDISPHNILVGIDGIARLTDFGIAKAEDRISHTREGQIKGKLGYMAPEYASNGVIDARSDLFSVGTILWECLTYKRLFAADSTAESLRKLLVEPIPPPSSINKGCRPFDEILNKALSREPDERFQTADEFSEALESIAANHGGTASLREVGKTVRKHASARIDREKALVRESLHSLRVISERRDPALDSAHDSVSDASVKSSSRSSALSKSSQSASSLSFQSGERPISSRSESVDDALSGGRHFQDQASGPSAIEDPVPSKTPRTNWFAAIAIVWCVVLAGIAIYTVHANKPKSLRVIEMSPLQEPAETFETKPPTAIARAKEQNLAENQIEPKNRAFNPTNESTHPSIPPMTDRGVPTVENKKSIEQPEKNRSQSKTVDIKQKNKNDKIVATDEKKAHAKERKRTLRETPNNQSRSSQSKRPTIHRNLSIDELPAYNPYLSTK